MTTDHETSLRATYAAFNERDIDAVLARMTADVDWPNAWEGGRAVGPDAVREYWARQWAAIDPHVQPTAFVERPLVGEGDVVHVYAFRDGLISRMDVEE
jgi:ketosteroid isomerase-like protein